MTEPLGSATVLVRPDTTKFRAELQAQLGAMKPIVVPVVAAAAGSTTAGLTAVQRESKAVSSATRELKKDVEKTTRSMSQLERGAGATGLSLLGVRGATLAASGAFLAGAAAVTLFAKSIFSAVSLGRQLSVFQKTTGATADEMQRVSEAARQMGQDLTLPGISAGDAATAMSELAKAGLSVEDAISGARGVLQLAIAAQISFADATTLAASALNAFGLSGDEAVHVADVLANAANMAQGSISDMGLALQQAAAVGRQVGLSLQDTSTFLTILAREGLRGSDAGTSLRVTLGRLINPTVKIQAELDKLGVSLRDASGAIRPDFFVDLGIAMRGMAKAQKDATLAVLGGMDGMRALSILTRQSITDLIDFRKGLDEQGTASDLAQARMTGLAGASSNLANTMEGIGISIGQKATPALTSFTNALTQVASVTANTVGSLNAAFDVRAILAAVAAYKLLPPILAAIGATARGASVGIFTMLGALNPLHLILAGVTAALVVAATRTSVSAGAAKALAQASRELSTAMSEVARTTTAAADAQRTFESEGLALSTARLNAQLAKLAVTNSKAAAGSIDLKILQNQAAIAIDNVRIAEDNLAKARSRTIDAAAEAAQAEINRRDALAGQARVLTEITAAETQGFISREKVIQVIRKQADEQAALNTKESRGLAQRLRILAELRRSVDEVPTQKQIEIFLETRGVAKGLAQLLRAMDAAGAEDADAYADALLSGLNDLPGKVVRSLQATWDAVVNGWAQAGARSHAAFFQFLDLGGISAAIAKAQAFATAPGVSTSRQQQIDLARARGDLGTALAASQRRESVQKRIMEIARAKKDQELYDEALKNYLDAVAESQSIQAEILSNQKSAASAAEAAASDAQKALDAADQAFLRDIDRRRTLVEISQIRADMTATLKDDIAAAKTERAVILASIAQARTEIHDQQLRADVILQLTVALAQTDAAIKQLTAQRKKNQQQIREARRERLQRQKEAAREHREESLRLDIEFAQTTENVGSEIAARKRYRSFLRKLYNQAKGDWLERKRLRNMIAQETQSIKELQEAQKKKNNAGKELLFAFLQTQQGFASTVMSNLLPAGVLSGALGGQAAPSAPGPGISQWSQTQAAGERTTTSGQTATMIEVLRQILRVLQYQSRGSAHPEARHQRAMGSAAMDMM